VGLGTLQFSEATTFSIVSAKEREHSSEDTSLYLNTFPSYADMPRDVSAKAGAVVAQRITKPIFWS